MKLPQHNFIKAGAHQELYVPRCGHFAINLEIQGTGYRLSGVWVPTLWRTHILHQAAMADLRGKNVNNQALTITSVFKSDGLEESSHHFRAVPTLSRCAVRRAIG